MFSFRFCSSAQVAAFCRLPASIPTPPIPESPKATLTWMFLYRDPESDEVALSLIQNDKLEYHPPLEDYDDSEEGEN